MPALPIPLVIGGLTLMGGVGYVGQSFSFFTALTMANAGLVALLLYLYPAIVALLSAALFHERLDRPRVVAVVIAFVGTALTVGPKPAGSLPGIALGIAAAFIYSGYIMAGTHLLRRSSPISGSLVIMMSAALVFGVITVTLFLVGITVIGPTKASVLSTFEPVTTVILAALVLGEPWVSSR